MDGSFPSVDAGVRQRLILRFGSEVEAWFNRLPDVLRVLARRWQFELCSQIARGSVSVVFRCRIARRRLAMRLAEQRPSSVMLHGDLTPRNILDGGDERGLVAIDPAPCVGDRAFDAIDMILWRADNVETIETRTSEVAEATGCDRERLLLWCVAFAAMGELDVASERDRDDARVDALLRLASRAPVG